MSNHPASNFSDLGVPDELVEALRQARINEPFEIQALTIPDALAGRDILGRAPTGSGKTLAFGIPALARLADRPRADRRRPRGLILSPTRELAEQIARELEPLAYAVDRSLLAVYGGKGLNAQVKALAKGVDVVIACPGRLLDLVSQEAVSLADVEVAVVDEADRMADMGFLPDVRRILDQTASDRQTVLFSATLDNDVQVLIDKYQNDPVEHAVADLEPDLSVMEHRFIQVPKKERLAYLADVIDDTGPTVVFVRTRHGVDRLARQLRQQGVSAGYIHGGRSQSQRDRALAVFTEGKVQALVATDVAARGIHVDGVACVAHYDPPADIKDYVHRSGRTARAGAAGMVVSFLDPGQVRESEKMQRKLGIDAEIEDPVESPGRQARLDATARKPLKAADGPARNKPKSRKQAAPQKQAASRRQDGAETGSGSDRPGSGRTGSERSERSDRNDSERSERSGRTERTNRSGPSNRSGGKKRGGAKKRAGSREWAESSGQRSGSGSAAGGAGKPKKKPSGTNTGGAKSAQAGKRKTKRSGKPRPPNRKKTGGRSGR